MTQLQPGEQRRTREEGRGRGGRGKEKEREKKNTDVAFVKLPHLIIDVWRTAENNLSGKVSQKLHRFLPPVKIAPKLVTCI